MSQHANTFHALLTPKCLNLIPPSVSVLSVSAGCVETDYVKNTGFFTVVYFRYGYAGFSSLRALSTQLFLSSRMPSTPQHFPLYFYSTWSQTIQYLCPFISKTEILKIRGWCPLTNWVKIDDLCSLGTLTILYYIPCPREDLHHLPCLSFGLPGISSYCPAAWWQHLEGFSQGEWRVLQLRTMLPLDTHSCHLYALAHTQPHTHMQEYSHTQTSALMATIRRCQTYVIFKS